MARMTPEALKGKIAELEKQLKKMEQNKAPAIRQVLALMKKSGLTIEDLGKPVVEVKRGRKPGAKAAPKAKGTGSVAIKYRDDQGNTWTGRGRTPVWLAAAEKAGRNREEFRVADAAAQSPAV